MAKQIGQRDGRTITIKKIEAIYEKEVGGRITTTNLDKISEL